MYNQELINPKNEVLWQWLASNMIVLVSSIMLIFIQIFNESGNPHFPEHAVFILFQPYFDTSI